LPGPPTKIPNIPSLKAPPQRSETERKPMRGGKERLASPRPALAPPAARPDERKDESAATSAVPLAVLVSKSRPTLSLVGPPSETQVEDTITSVRGSSQADEDAPTNVSPESAGKNRAPSEVTSVDSPTGEHRAEGSDFILPANPFGELTDESLEAFVECTLYQWLA
jgi:hypothetical protein